MYWVQQRLRSQNFLVNRELVNRLIRGSLISSSDLVLDIGAGTGLITRQLLSVARKVIAIELDFGLFNKLKSKLGLVPNLELVHTDFLHYPLPKEPYKIFANTPFSITGNIIRRLLQSPLPPIDSYLVVQAEAAAKFTIHPTRNTLAAILYYPYWDIRVVHQFARLDFWPPPGVDCVLLRLLARPVPLLAIKQHHLYQDFVAYHFTRNRFSAHVSPAQWLKLFARLLDDPRSFRLSAVRGAYARLQGEQSRLKKIHRTRTDPNWKRYTRF